MSVMKDIAEAFRNITKEEINEMKKKYYRFGYDDDDVATDVKQMIIDINTVLDKRKNELFGDGE